MVLYSPGGYRKRIRGGGGDRHVSVDGNSTPHLDGSLYLERAHYIQLPEDLDLVPAFLGQHLSLILFGGGVMV